MIGYTGGFVLGAGLGANDAANVFGTAVGARMVSFRTAACLAAVCIVIGAGFQGARGIETISALTEQSRHSAVVTTFAAASAVVVMTALKLPASTSQAVVGAILGVGMMQNDLYLGGLLKVVICWITTPLGALLCYLVLDYVFRRVLRRLQLSIFALDPLIRAGLILCGCYGAYALGANNAANVGAVFVSAGMLRPQTAAIFGGLSIAFGVLTFSRPVMLTVGRGILTMDAFSALMAVFASAIAVHFYAMVGVPVSTSQAIVGGVLGISLVKGMQIVRVQVLANVVFGWLVTPVLGAAAAILLMLATQ